MPTGSGKSITMALLIAEMQVPVLIVVPNLTLKTQLQDSFRQYFGSLKGITIENIDSPALEQAKDYGMLILDEAHHGAASTYRRLSKKAWSGIYYRYHFTATPYRSQDEEQMLLESIIGQVVYRLSYQDAVAAKMIVPIEAYYIEIPKQKVKGHYWAEVYSELVVNHKDRNKAIADLLERLKGHSTLCLVTEIKHGENICKLTGGYFASGVNEDTKHYITMFNNGTMRQLVGTTGILGEGTDTKPAEWVIIAGLGKAKGRFQQQIGRVLRTYTGKESGKVILIKDASHKWTRNHFREQIKTLREEYGIAAVKLEL